MVGHEQTRLNRLKEIENIYKIAKEEEKEIDINKLIAECSLKWGVSRRTMLQYFQILKDGNRI